jgi:hypothetical protein
MTDLILNKLTKPTKPTKHMEVNNAQFQNGWEVSLEGLLHSHCNVVDLLLSCWKKRNIPSIQLNATETLATTHVHWNCNLATHTPLFFQACNYEAYKDKQISKACNFDASSTVKFATLMQALLPSLQLSRYLIQILLISRERCDS